MEYDAAGNLTTDKDGYIYEYDYENRIVKITKDSNDIAEFAYDALGRRIRKYDAVADVNTLYYYNNNWQVLAEYNGSDEFQRWFAYGNYIDEVLIMSTSFAPPLTRFYIHDHLYSPVVLTSFVGVVLERYEYDAYGNCRFGEPNFALLATQKSNYGNPYLFTGRRVDILDTCSLKIQYSRNRYYDYYTGRFIQPDPIGYDDGLNLYTYVHNNPVINLDPRGTACTGISCSTGSRTCGIREYRELVFAGGGIPHAGLLLGLHEDIDFGPSGFPWVVGECPFNGGVKWGTVRTWDLEIKKTGKIKYGHPERPLCCCATCGDVAGCVRKTCQEWNGTFFDLLIRNCWSFVRAAKSNCCLKRK